MKEKLMQIINTMSIFVAGVLIGIVLSVMLKESNKKDTFTFYTYENISTAIDERGRLHMSFYEDEQTYILSDSVALGIHAQVSSEIYKDYLDKVKN